MFDKVDVVVMGIFIVVIIVGIEEMKEKIKIEEEDVEKVFKIDIEVVEIVVLEMKMIFDVMVLIDFVIFL